MKAITINQPFASLIAEGYKRYEFRSWHTNYRGDILIHAGKTVDREGMNKFAYLGLDCPTGCIVAKATITDCVEVDEALKAMLREEDFTVYSGTTEAENWHGYGFKLGNVIKIKPVEVSGKLGLWDCDIDI